MMLPQTGTSARVPWWLRKSSWVPISTSTDRYSILVYPNLGSGSGYTDTGPRFLDSPHGERQDLFADSTDRRITLAKSIGWCFEVWYFSWSFVKPSGDGVQFILLNGGQIQTFRNVLPKQAVGIFVRATLPRLLRVGLIYKSIYVALALYYWSISQLPHLIFGIFGIIDFFFILLFALYLKDYEEVIAQAA